MFSIKCLLQAKNNNFSNCYECSTFISKIASQNRLVDEKKIIDMMETFIDFTRFEIPNRNFIIKEIRAINASNNRFNKWVYDCDDYIFKPSSDVNHSVVTNDIVDQCGNTHGIMWDADDLSYAPIEEVSVKLTNKDRN